VNHLHPNINALFPSPFHLSLPVLRSYHEPLFPAPPPLNLAPFLQMVLLLSIPIFCDSFHRRLKRRLPSLIPPKDPFLASARKTCLNYFFPTFFRLPTFTSLTGRSGPSQPFLPPPQPSPPASSRIPKIPSGEDCFAKDESPPYSARLALSIPLLLSAVCFTVPCDHPFEDLSSFQRFFRLHPSVVPPVPRCSFFKVPTSVGLLISIPGFLLLDPPYILV